MDVEVVRVRFLHDQREFHLPSSGIPLEAGDLLIVETDEGLDVCEVTVAAEGCPRRHIESPEATALRKATPHDLEWLTTKAETERAAAEACADMARKLGLDMQLAGVKMSFDGSRIVFSFTADQRVDFRTLVRDLAKRFHTRIEMRQIGVRDKAKQLGGIGICGRPFCCTTFLRGFEPVTMKMAKEQNLALSPTKISGCCGRLMCCLAYENEHYRGVREEYPPLGTRVATAQGEGEVKGVLPLGEAVAVLLDSGATVKVRRAEVTVLSGGRRK